MLNQKQIRIMMKKHILLSVATITMLCFIFAGCAGGSDDEAEEKTNKEEKSEEKATEKEKSAKAKESTSEITEDLYVEIVANQMYLSDKYNKNSEDMNEEEEVQLSMKMSEELNELYEKHGITEEDFEQFANEIMEDDMKCYNDLMDRANKRAEKLLSEDE